MSVDLKGNTNYVIFRDKPTIDPVTGEKTPGPYIVPRTALSAIDMVAGNDIIVEDDTIRVREATVDDIIYGTTASGVVTADILKQAVDQGYIVPATAAVADIIEGNGEKTLISPMGLKGSLTSGKAVDVTSQPSVSAGTLTSVGGIKGTLTWTGNTGTFGFYDNSSKFPKFADGLVYLMMADVMNTGDSDVVISADNVLNDTLPVTLEAGEEARIAFLFDTATNGYFTATGSEFTLKLTHVREFEVTGCTDKAREYVASVDDPNDFNAFYLVDTDTVNPWLYIINMHSSPVTTVQAGLAYKLYANDGELHTLMVDTIPANYYGRDAKLVLFVGQGSMIQTAAPLRMAEGNSFTDNTLNNCSVHFQDGIATITVDSTESSYNVTLAGGTYTTEAGTLYSGINGSTATLLIFNVDTNGYDCSMYGAVANKNKQLYGNGVDNTIVTGTGAFGSYTGEFENLTLKDVTISGTTVNFVDRLNVVGSLTNNAAVTVKVGSTIKLFGSSNSNAAISGTGSMTLGNGTVIDASQNEAGAVLINQSVNTGVGVTVLDSNGRSYSVVDNSSYTSMLSDGTLCYDLYVVSVASGTGSDTLYHAIDAGIADGIVFAHSLDGQTVSLSPAVISGQTVGTYATGDVTIVGNGNGQSGITLEGGITGRTSSLVFDTTPGQQLYTTGTIHIANVNTIQSFNAEDKVVLNNVNVTGATDTRVSQNNNAVCIVRGADGVQVKGCTFTDCVTKNKEYGWGCICLNGSTDSYVYDSDFINYSGKAVMMYVNGTTTSGCSFINDYVGVEQYSGSTTIENCYFSGSTSSAIWLGNSYGKSTTTVSGCTFATAQDKIITKAYQTPSQHINTFTLSNNIFNGDITVAGDTLVNFANVNVLNSTVSGAGTVKLADGATLDLSGNTNSTVISGGTITVEDTATVIPYDGGTPVTVSGSGTTLSNMGVLS